MQSVCYCHCIKFHTVYSNYPYRHRHLNIQCLAFTRTLLIDSYLLCNVFLTAEQAVEREGEEPVQAPAEEAKVELACCVLLQKELVDGLVDEECGKAVPDGHAGLCVCVYPLTHS